MIRFSQQLNKIINAVGVVGQTFALSPRPAGGQAATGALTANTRFTVAHGLGYTPTPYSIRLWVVSPNDDTTAPYSVAIVATSSTTITLKPSASVAAADVSIVVVIALETDVGGRNYAVA